MVLRMQTYAGITGLAKSASGMMPGGPRVVQTILEHEIKPILVGEDPAFPRRIRADLWKALEYYGVGAVSHSRSRQRTLPCGTSSANRRDAGIPNARSLPRNDAGVSDVRLVLRRRELGALQRDVDANQVFNSNEALRRGRLYQQFLVRRALAAAGDGRLRGLAHELDTRTATGENLATKYTFADLIARRAADVGHPTTGAREA